MSTPPVQYPPNYRPPEMPAPAPMSEAAIQQAPVEARPAQPVPTPIAPVAEPVVVPVAAQVEVSKTHEQIAEALNTVTEVEAPMEEPVAAELQQEQRLMETAKDPHRPDLTEIAFAGEDIPEA